MFETTSLNQPPDLSCATRSHTHPFFRAQSLAGFDEQSGQGTLQWVRGTRVTRMAFGQISHPCVEMEPWEFPPEYDRNPLCPVEISFVSERAVRIRMSARERWPLEEASLMLAGAVPACGAWTVSSDEERIAWKSPAGEVVMSRNPWRLTFRNAEGELVTQTHRAEDAKTLLGSKGTPFSFIRRTGDLERQMAAGFRLAPDEKIFGCGESFTRLNKRGRKLNLWTSDAHGCQTAESYKPVPFFISSRGYGMFVHSSAPMTFDFGQESDSIMNLHVGDDVLDLFVFLGTPKEILSEYTALTGRSPMPPTWSFGLWMSRITYTSESEVREVAEKLREQRIPCDVIHIDTGWFEKDWKCDYTFSSSRFEDPVNMISDLRDQGFRISLWQLPYFTPTNPLYREALDKGYALCHASGHPATEDAVVDFSNPEAVTWYQNLLANLLRAGVAAIKADFGEAAPVHGRYASGKEGWFEHNLYPLRYNRAVADITLRIRGEHIIWARSAWAGSQRYPIHWGGDAENTDGAMAASLRGGLSLGLCGFSFWSHDIGGFVEKSPEELYRRWLPFGMLTSHSRCHGYPPKEPWHYGEGFVEAFRKAVELKYRLMPYVLREARASAENGWPMLRTLFFEFPEDPGSWLIEDEYFFGRDLLVAPLMSPGTGRSVYLPPGEWIDYQSKAFFEGGRWYDIPSGELPCILLVREGAVIPHAPLVMSTDELDESLFESLTFSRDMSLTAP